MMKKKLIAAGMILTMLLTGCGNDSAGNQGNASDSTKEAESEAVQNDEDVICLTIATSGNWEGILRGELMEKYCNLINEWSDGHIVMKYYFNGVLGSDLEMIQAVADGTLCIINSVPSYQMSVVPEAALLDAPGVFGSIDEYNNFIQSDYFNVINSYYQKKGIRLLSSKAFTYREVTSTNALTIPADFQGLRMRTMENKYQTAFWQSTGATVSPMNFNETRVALMQNMVSAQENPISYMYSANLVDVQNYVLMTDHMPMVSNYLMNEERFQELSQEDQELVIRMLNEMDSELAERQQEEETALAADLESRGITITEASDEIQEMIAQGRSVVLDMLRKDLGAGKVDSFLAAVEKYK